MDNRLLLLHALPELGSCGCMGAVKHGRKRGGSKMPARGRCVAFQNVYSPALGRYVRRCARRGGGRGLVMGGVSGLGQAATMRGMFEDVKDVLVYGSIAAGGAIITNKVWGMIGKRLNLSGSTESLAIIITGIGLGVLVGKLTKKPRIGAAFAVGPVVTGLLKLSAPLVGKLGLVAVETPGPHPALQLPPIGALPQVGPGVPSWMTTPVSPEYSSYASY